MPDKKVGRPKKPTSEKKKTRTIRLTNDVANYLIGRYKTLQKAIDSMIEKDIQENDIWK